MATSHARHMAPKKPPHEASAAPSGASVARRACAALVIAALGAVLFEAGTVFGSFGHSVWDLPMWMPKRMLTAFVALLPVAWWLAGLPGRARKGVRRMGWPGLGQVARQPEWGFLALGLGFGTAFCLLMPTAAQVSWDGQIHFGTATALSYVYDAEYTGSDRIMTTAGPEGALYAAGDLARVEEHSVELDSRTIPFPQASLKADDLRDANEFFRQAERDEDVVTMRGTQMYPEGSYVTASTFGILPNAMGLWVGRLLRLDCVARYLLARLCNTYCYVLVCFLAIRSLRHGKLLLAALALCPTTLLEAANFSYDPLHVGLIALATARFAGFLQDDRELAPRDSLAMVVPLFLGALVKAVLFPLAFLLLCVPRDRRPSGRAWAIHVGLVMLAVALLLASFALPLLFASSSGQAVGDTRGGSNVSVAGQVSYVLAHPAQTLAMAASFAARMLNPLRMGLGLNPAGENLPYYAPYLVPSTAPLSHALAGLESALMVCLALLDGGPEDEGFAATRFKVTVVLVTGLSFALICAALYASFTDVGRDVISGVQYRYLTALLAPLALFLPNTRLRRDGRLRVPTGAFLAVETLLLAGVLLNTFVLA